MKNIIVFIVMATGILNTAWSQKSTNEFVVKGKLIGQNDGLMYLYYSNDQNKRIKDSSAFKNGSFYFKGKIKEPTMVYLQLKEEKRNENNSASFFIEPSVMKVNLKVNEFRKVDVTGSKSQVEYASLENSKATIRKEMEPLSKAYAASSEIYREAVKNKADEKTLQELNEKAAAIHEQFAPFNERVDKADYNFFAKHPKSYVTAYMMRFHVSERLRITTKHCRKKYCRRNTKATRRFSW